MYQLCLQEANFSPISTISTWWVHQLDMVEMETKLNNMQAQIKRSRVSGGDLDMNKNVYFQVANVQLLKSLLYISISIYLFFDCVSTFVYLFMIFGWPNLS